MLKSLPLRSALVSLLLLTAFLFIWHAATLPKTQVLEGVSEEYAALMGGGGPAVQPPRATCRCPDFLGEAVGPVLRQWAQ